RTVTRTPFSARAIAARNPATPLPMTIKSVARDINRNSIRSCPDSPASGCGSGFALSRDPYPAVSKRPHRFVKSVQLFGRRGTFYEHNIVFYLDRDAMEDIFLFDDLIDRGLQIGIRHIEKGRLCKTGEFSPGEGDRAVLADLDDRKSDKDITLVKTDRPQQIRVPYRHRCVSAV